VITNELQPTLGDVAALAVRTPPIGWKKLLDYRLLAWRPEGKTTENSIPRLGSGGNGGGGRIAAIHAAAGQYHRADDCWAVSGLDRLLMAIKKCTIFGKIKVYHPQAIVRAWSTSIFTFSCQFTNCSFFCSCCSL